MAVHTTKKGLDLPIAGEPMQEIEPGPPVTRIALLAGDYHGMKPTMFVRPGDRVKRGQPLFEDKKTPGVLYTAPGAGEIAAVNRGGKRALQSVVIDLNDAERSNAAGQEDETAFQSFTGNDVSGLSRDQIRDLLVESGMWTAFRTRPFSKVPPPGSEPTAIFVTAMDSNPLAPETDRIYEKNEDAFQQGLLCVAKLREGNVFLCKAEGSVVQAASFTGVRTEEFRGIHPAGTPGLHIHTLMPAHRERTVWHIGLQDVVAIGKLFSTGQIDIRRVVSFAGPSVRKPRLITTRLGASTDEIVAGELKEGEARVISGSVLSGRTAQGEVHGYLGRYHQQISVLCEGREREFLGWLSPGLGKFSTVNTFLSKLTPKKRFDFTTTTNGSPRAMVPIGMFEAVMPLDILPTFLLRALIMGDVERSIELGCLELDEEDLSLCTFVCPGKCEYGPHLRAVLTQIEKEG